VPEGVDAINKSAKAKAPLSLTFGDPGSNSHPILVTSARASSSAMDLVRRAKSWLMVRGFAVLDYLGMPCPELKKLEASFKKYTERRNVAIPPERERRKELLGSRRLRQFSNGLPDAGSQQEL
jgi:hypothetical protein